MARVASGFASAIYGGLQNMYSSHYQAQARAYSEFASCRLGRRGRSVRSASRRESGGRKVDPDYLAKQAALQAQLHMQQALTAQWQAEAARHREELRKLLAGWESEKKAEEEAS